MDPAEAGTADAVHRRLRRAVGLLREAGRDLAALAEGQQVLGATRVHTADSKAAARELIDFGVARYGAVDVIVIARPTGRRRTTHHGPSPGAKEQHDGPPRHHEEDRGQDAG